MEKITITLEGEEKTLNRVLEVLDLKEQESSFKWYIKN